MNGTFEHLEEGDKEGIDYSWSRLERTEVGGEERLNRKSMYRCM